MLRLLTLSIIATQAQAGIRITLDDQGETEVSCYQDGKSSVSINGDISSIADAKTQTVWEFNHEHQVFTKVDIHSYPEMMKSIANKQAEAIKTSPFYQQMVDFHKANANKHKIEVRSTGTKTIADIEAQAFEILKDGKVIKEIWTSPALLKRIESEFPEKTFTTLFQEGEKLVRAIMPIDEEWNAEAEIEAGSVVVFVSEVDLFFGGNEVMQSLVSVVEEAIDPSEFALPVDYKEVDFETFIALEDSEGEDEDESNNW